MNPTSPEQFTPVYMIMVWPSLYYL